MKKTVLILSGFLMITQCIYSAPELKPDQYTEVELEVLKSQPEKYRNKKVCYESIYDKYMTTFPPYADKNGFKAGKYYWFLITPLNLPVITKKTDAMNDLVLVMKKRSKVKVYGKVKKFRIAPQQSMMPAYYLELVDIKILEEPKEKETGNNDETDKSARPKRPILPRRPPHRKH